jgi:hypothetical protein
MFQRSWERQTPQLTRLVLLTPHRKQNINKCIDWGHRQLAGECTAAARELLLAAAVCVCTRGRGISFFVKILLGSDRRVV